MLARWRSTVLRLSTRIEAMSLLDAPSLTRARTSRSRGESGIRAASVLPVTSRASSASTSRWSRSAVAATSAASEERPDVQEEQHDVVRNGEEPFDQRQPPVQVSGRVRIGVVQPHPLMVIGGRIAVVHQHQVGPRPVDETLQFQIPVKPPARDFCLNKIISSGPRKNNPPAPALP